MSLKTAKNLLGNRDIYNKYYGDFRGVDFSSDHTQVSEQRFSYAVNMYKDYMSGQAQGIETIPGFRRRFVLPGGDACCGAPVYGIHAFGEMTYLHIGESLYAWDSKDRGVSSQKHVLLSSPTRVINDGLSEISVWEIHAPYRVVKVYDVLGNEVTCTCEATEGGYLSTVMSRTLKEGDFVYQTFIHDADGAIFTGLAERKSVSFVFDSRLYIMDGRNYLVIDAGGVLCNALSLAYTPTTYINAIPAGENADGGTEFEQRNMLSPYFKNTFYGDGESTEFYLSEKIGDAADIVSVIVYGEELLAEDFELFVNEGTGLVGVRTAQAPPRPTDAGYTEDYAGVVITAKKQWENDTGENIENDIVGCTIATIFDKRVFLSGNPKCPNKLFYSALNDPLYFPSVNWDNVGVTNSNVTGLLPIAGSLMVLKEDASGESSVHFYSAVATGEDLYPKRYESVSGLAGVGCLGSCINFADDPVFVSKMGLDAMGQLSVRLERSVEHRSSLVDARLTCLDLSRACLEVYRGYLFLLCDGKVFMADKRQMFTHTSGSVEYEWYYLEDIGVWEGQYLEYRYSSYMPPELLDDGGLPKYRVGYCTACKSGGDCDCPRSSFLELALELAPDTDEAINPPDGGGKSGEKIHEAVLEIQVDGGVYNRTFSYYVKEEYSPYYGEVISRHAYLCEARGNHIGGVFRPACVIKAIGDNLYFGTEDGVICSFNFDKRGESGEIADEWYTFDGRTIFCGVATKMDCCGIPHLTKNTVKKSTVIKTKMLQSLGLKVKVRTNRQPFKQIARISGRRFSFDRLELDDLTFVLSDDTLFAVKEKEKKWVEKQYFLFSDEYMKPFSLFYISYRYLIAGRYKN